MPCSCNNWRSVVSSSPSGMLCLASNDTPAAGFRMRAVFMHLFFPMEKQRLFLALRQRFATQVSGSLVGYRWVFLLDTRNSVSKDTVLENDSTYAITLQTDRPHGRIGISPTLTHVPASHTCGCP